MKKLYSVIGMFILLAFVAGTTQMAYGLDKKAIQGAMENFIKEKTAAQGGTYDIDGTKAEFDYVHDGVMEKDGLFVSCAEFKAGADGYDLDYYVKADNGKYTVVKEILHKKNKQKVNKVLWEAGN